MLVGARECLDRFWKRVSDAAMFVPVRDTPWSDWWAAWTGHGTPGREILRRFGERDLVGLCIYDSGIRCFYNVRRPVHEPADLHDLAGKTHGWYHKAHVLNEPEEITKARLVLARAAQIVLANGLSLLGITAPERM